MGAARPCEGEEQLTVATNFVLVAIGFVSLSVGVIVYKKRKLFVLFVALGLVLFTVPFVRHWYYTRDAYEWTIAVERDVAEAGDPETIFIERIEWITDYEVLKRQRGDVRSLILNEETTSKEWNVRGFTPVAIRAEVLAGSNEFAVTRNFTDLDPGRYTFTLEFDEQDVPRWQIEPSGPDE
jgi:hypothetical protein